MRIGTGDSKLAQRPEELSDESMKLTEPNRLILQDNVIESQDKFNSNENIHPERFPQL